MTRTRNTYWINYISVPVLGLHVCRGWQQLQQAVPATDLASVSYCRFCWLPRGKRTMYTDAHMSQEKVKMRWHLLSVYLPWWKRRQLHWDRWLRGWQGWKRGDSHALTSNASISPKSRIFPSSCNRCSWKKSCGNFYSFANFQNTMKNHLNGYIYVYSCAH